MDHGTTGVSFTILSSSTKDEISIKHFKISREELSAGKVSAIQELSKRVKLDSINLMAITYAMGDGLSTIKPIKKVKNRGILSINGAGKVTGGGTAVYTEIENSGIPTIIIPGLHNNTPCLDPRFAAAYSHHASAEKVSITYNAFLETGWKNMIVADISSNSVTMLVQKGIIIGAIDACLGSMGIIHGPLDLKMLRQIDEGKKQPMNVFLMQVRSKLLKLIIKYLKFKDELLEMVKNGDERAMLAIETMMMTIAMEILGVLSVLQIK